VIYAAAMLGERVLGRLVVEKQSVSGTTNLVMLF